MNIPLYRSFVLQFYLKISLRGRQFHPRGDPPLWRGGWAASALQLCFSALSWLARRGDTRDRRHTRGRCRSGVSPRSTPLPPRVAVPCFQHDSTLRQPCMGTATVPTGPHGLVGNSHHPTRVPVLWVAPSQGRDHPSSGRKRGAAPRSAGDSRCCRRSWAGSGLSSLSLCGDSRSCHVPG